MASLASNVAYDFGVAVLNGRAALQPQLLRQFGQQLEQARCSCRCRSIFLKIETFSFKVYGSLGNFWVDQFQTFGLPSQDYWYWQIGLVTSAWGLDMTVAYTDTSIEPTGCGNTHNCAPRAFVSLTKTFSEAAPYPAGAVCGADLRESLRRPFQARLHFISVRP